ncbi:MAG: hypothetical protein AAF626_10475 [Pseudomonadota bacterium]
MSQIQFDEREENGRWVVEKTFPTELKDQRDAVSVTGYYVPVLAEAYVTQFILVPQPYACPFCGSDSYGLALEVHVAEPMPDLEEGTRIEVRGMIELVESGDTYQSIILTDAALVD